MVAIAERPVQFASSPERTVPTPRIESPPLVESPEVEYDITRVPLHTICVLQQVRKTFEGIPELADDIAHKGLMSPLLVAELNAAETECYLAVINDLWKTEYKVDDLISTDKHGQIVYRILIAGERRLRSIRHLQENGCGECRDSEMDCFHFSKKFRDGTVPATLCVGISATEALNRQSSENTHMSVPPHEEAIFYYEYYRILQETVDPNYPIERFARDVGRNPETVRNALRYCALSDRVRGLVEQRILKYGIACILTRYQHHDATRKTDDELYYLALLNKDQKVEDFDEMVAADTARIKAGQMSLEKLMYGHGELVEEQRSRVRLTFARRIVQGLHGVRRYIKSINEALLQGKIGLENSPYSESSPVKMIIRAAEDLHSTARVFRAARLMSRPAADRVLTQTAEVITEGNLWLPHTSDAHEAGLNVFGATIYAASQPQNNGTIVLESGTKPAKRQLV